mgnify:CR=1 FL=1
MLKYNTMQHEMQHGDDTIFSCQQIDSNFMLELLSDNSLKNLFENVHLNR